MESEGCKSAVHLPKWIDVHLGDAVWLFKPRIELGDAACFIMPEFSDDATSEGDIEVVFGRVFDCEGGGERRVAVSVTALAALKGRREPHLVNLGLGWQSLSHESRR